MEIFLCKMGRPHERDDKYQIINELIDLDIGFVVPDLFCASLKVTSYISILFLRFINNLLFFPRFQKVPMKGKLVFCPHWNVTKFENSISYFFYIKFMVNFRILFNICYFNDQKINYFFIFN